jgi:phosphonatase-like hydrolase
MDNIELVVFDIAGTTVHDKGNVAASFLDAFAGYGYSISREAAQDVMGFRKKDAIRILLDKFYPGYDGNGELIGKIHDAFTRNMISFYEKDEDLQPLPNAEEMFLWLKEKGIKLALNTGFTKAITDTVLNRLGWKSGSTVDCIISSDEVEHGRPHPDMILAVMKQLDIKKPSSVAKVGDTEVDVEEGRLAGCSLIISVTTGAYTRARLEQYHPDYIIDNLSELKSILQ